MVMVLLAGCHKRPPTVTCTVSPQQITQDEKATVHANVVVPKKGMKVTYAWTSSGGKVSGKDDTATFDATGVVPGKYSVTVTVADKYKHSVPCMTEITVEKKYLPPTVTCSVSPSSIQVGETATVRANATSPDGSPLTYSWTVSGTPQAASAPDFTFGSAGRQPGESTIAVTVNTGKYSYTVTATVDNGRGGRASCTMTVNISQKIKVPGFASGRNRVDNVAKAILDNAAVQMKNDPHLRASIAGYTDGSRHEARIKGLGLKRAQAVVDYLVSKGIDASRLSATDGGVSTIGDKKTEAGRKENRRAEILLSVH
jgi:outer membrane protein OmpA-like peptidoglycan-associated protein